jgi:hypothetical protein
VPRHPPIEEQLDTLPLEALQRRVRTFRTWTLAALAAITISAGDALRTSHSCTNECIAANLLLTVPLGFVGFFTLLWAANRWFCAQRALTRRAMTPAEPPDLP